MSIAAHAQRRSRLVAQPSEQHLGRTAQVQRPVVGGEEEQRAEQRPDTEHSRSTGPATALAQFLLEPLGHAGSFEQAEAPSHLLVRDHRAPALHRCLVSLVACAQRRLGRGPALDVARVAKQRLDVGQSRERAQFTERGAARGGHR